MKREGSFAAGGPSSPTSICAALALWLAVAFAGSLSAGEGGAAGADGTDRPASPAPPQAGPAIPGGSLPALRPSALRPPPVRPGDAVALIAPASPTRSGDLEEAAANLRRLGYRAKIAPQATDREGYLAGSDAARAEAINRAFADPEVRLILCVRGGYGSPRILDRIDYGLVRRSPKAIVGFSDITALLIAIRQRTGLVTFHGPMAEKDFSGRGGLSPFSEEHLFSLIGPDPFRPGAPPFSDWGSGLSGAPPRRTLRGGAAEGPLVGGNLSTIAALMGTPFEIDARGAILFLEDVNEEPFRIDRMIRQLELGGKLAAAKGIIIGGFTRCEAKSPKESLSLWAIFETYFGDLGIPVLAGFPTGHIPQQATLPLGVRVRLDAGARTVSILEPAVEERPGAPPPAEGGVGETPDGRGPGSAPRE
jgi:muramoyltetrapeptide carboxypeptidase